MRQFTRQQFERITVRDEGEHIDPYVPFFYPASHRSWRVEYTKQAINNYQAHRSFYFSFFMKTETDIKPYQGQCIDRDDRVLI